jgi:Na+-driven multidrug efflux pump
MIAAGLLEDLQISVTTTFASRIHGNAPMATHNALLSIFEWLTAGSYGLVNATIVRIGNHLGANRPAKARLVSQICMSVAFSFGIVVAAVLFFSRHVLSRFFSDDPEVAKLTAPIVSLLAGCYVLLSFFFTSVAVLEGQARPTMIAAGFVIGAWGVTVRLRATQEPYSQRIDSTVHLHVYSFHHQPLSLPRSDC